MRTMIGMAVLATMVSVARGEHVAGLEWMKDYKNAEGVGCCNTRDCVPATVAVLEQGATHTVVMVGEETLRMPNASVHASQKASGFWCYKAMVGFGAHHENMPSKATENNTRCVFYLSTN